MRFAIKRTFPWQLILVAIFAFSACRQIDRNTGDPTSEPWLESTVESVHPLQESTEAPTPVVANPVLVAPDQSQQKNDVTPNPEPLRFAFPTPGPVPVSAWRPPLYPTPWALTPYDHFYFSRPIAADEVNWPLADYRYGGVFLPDVVHTGIDIPAPRGTPVMAAGPGRVTWAGYGLYRGVEDTTDPYGLAVTVKHDFGYQGETLYSVYGHLNRIDVVVGQHVEAGDVVGIVGETGNVTGPHLHFEIRLGRNNFFVSRNPELWLAPPQGWGILAARVMNSISEPLFSHEVEIVSADTNQTWLVNTYGKGTVVSDTYYQENLVIGDLPAGDYVIWIAYEGSTYDLDISIKPGMVSYFTFKGKRGYNIQPPPTPTVNFTPPVDTVTATP